MSFAIGHTSVANPDQASRPSERYCVPCRSWYDGTLRACPHCEMPKPAFNKRLRTAALDNQLYSQAANAR